MGAAGMLLQPPQAVRRHAEHGRGVEHRVVRAFGRRPFERGDMGEALARVLLQKGAGALVLLADGVPVADGRDDVVGEVLEVEGGLVDERQVVLLHGVLDEELPVARQDELDRARGHQVLAVVGRELLGHIAEVVHEAFGVGVEAHEDEAAPSLETDRLEAVIALVEVERLVHAVGAPEGAVEVVDPAVVGADESAAVALVLGHLRTPVAACVGEGPHLAVAPARDDERHTHIVDGEVVARIWYLIDAPEEVPYLHEDMLDLGAIEGFVDIAPGRQGGRLLQRLMHARHSAPD